MSSARILVVDDDPNVLSMPRRTLEANDAGRLIHTVRGVGFSLREV